MILSKINDTLENQYLAKIKKTHYINNNYLLSLEIEKLVNKINNLDRTDPNFVNLFYRLRTQLRYFNDLYNESKKLFYSTITTRSNILTIKQKPITTKAATKKTEKAPTTPTIEETLTAIKKINIETFNGSSINGSSNISRSNNISNGNNVNTLHQTILHSSTQISNNNNNNDNKSIYFDDVNFNDLYTNNCVLISLCAFIGICISIILGMLIKIIKKSTFNIKHAKKMNSTDQLIKPYKNNKMNNKDLIVRETQKQFFDSLLKMNDENNSQSNTYTSFK